MVILNVEVKRVRSYFPRKDVITLNGINVYDVCPKCKGDYNKCSCVCVEEDYIKAGLPW